MRMHLELMEATCRSENFSSHEKFTQLKRTWFKWSSYQQAERWIEEIPVYHKSVPRTLQGYGKFSCKKTSKLRKNGLNSNHGVLQFSSYSGRFFTTPRQHRHVHLMGLLETCCLDRVCFAAEKGKLGVVNWILLEYKTICSYKTKTGH